MQGKKPISNVTRSALTGSSPVLVVIDTVARNFGPGDENSTKDMSTFIQAATMIGWRVFLLILRN